MLSEIKRIKYAINILKAIHRGADSISRIYEDIGGSESYIAKVIATLRAHKLINKQYETCKPVTEITISDVVKCVGSYEPGDKLMDSINDKILEALDVPISEVW